MSQLVINAWKETYTPHFLSKTRLFSNRDNPHFVEYFLGFPSLLLPLEYHIAYFFGLTWLFRIFKSLIKLIIVFPFALINEQIKSWCDSLTHEVLKKIIRGVITILAGIKNFNIILSGVLAYMAVAILFAPAETAVLTVVSMILVGFISMIVGNEIEAYKAVVQMNESRISHRAISPPIYRHLVQRFLNLFDIRDSNVVTFDASIRDSWFKSAYFFCRDFRANSNMICPFTKKELSFADLKEAECLENKIVKWRKIYCFARILPQSILQECITLPPKLAVKFNFKSKIRDIGSEDGKEQYITYSKGPTNASKYLRSPYGYYYLDNQALRDGLAKKSHCHYTERYLLINMMEEITLIDSQSPTPRKTQSLEDMQKQKLCKQLRELNIKGLLSQEQRRVLFQLGNQTPEVLSKGENTAIKRRNLQMVSQKKSIFSFPKNTKPKKESCVLPCIKLTV